MSSIASVAYLHYTQMKFRSLPTDHSSIHSFSHLFIQLLIHLSIQPLIHSFIYSLMHSHIYSPIQSFIHSFNLLHQQVLSRDIRHLLVRDSTGKIVSMFSMKDLCKCVVARHSQVRRSAFYLTISRLGPYVKRYPLTIATRLGIILETEIDNIVTPVFYFNLFYLGC